MNENTDDIEHEGIEALNDAVEYLQSFGRRWVNYSVAAPVDED